MKRLTVMVFGAGAAVGGALVALVLLSRLRSASATRAGLESELEKQQSLTEAERQAFSQRHGEQLAALHQRSELQEKHHAEQLKAAEEKLALVRASREQLRDEMKAVAGDVLKDTGAHLTRELAAQRKADEARAIGELARRTEEIKRVVEPIGEKLGRVEGKVEQLERDRKQSEGQLDETLRALREGVGSLATQADNLSTALKRPATRGSWGEIQLRNVIEMAGMVDHCDFVEQATINTDDGKLRPDVLVRLPGGKLVVVDSKVPLDAYLSHIEAATDEERELHLARHAKQTREHITKLASKGYQSQFDTTPELVVMFVPSDGIYHAALGADPTLLEYGVGQQVLLATPMTLIALLRAIHYGWKQELIAESAREIADVGRELHKRLATFTEPLAKLGRQLGSAVGSYNDAVGSFDSRVVPQLRKIEQAGAGSSKQVPVLAPVEGTTRSLTSGLEPVTEAAAELAAAEAADDQDIDVTAGNAAPTDRRPAA